MEYLILLKISNGKFSEFNSGPMNTIFSSIIFGVKWRKNASHFSSVSASNWISAPLLNILLLYYSNIWMLELEKKAKHIKPMRWIVTVSFNSTPLFKAPSRAVKGAVAICVSIAYMQSSFSSKNKHE